jgi:hypothetical protein
VSGGCRANCGFYARPAFWQIRDRALRLTGKTRGLYLLLVNNSPGNFAKIADPPRLVARD